MVEIVEHNTALDVVKRRLDERLEKARIYTELLPSCQPLFRLLKNLKTLKEAGAELHLLKCKLKRGVVHPIERKFIKHYAICDKLQLEECGTENGNYAKTGLKLFGGEVFVYLGERNPFIPRQGEKVETTVGEIRQTVGDINRYFLSLKRYGVEVSRIELPEEDSLKVVIGDKYLHDYRTIDIDHVSDYSYLNMEIPEEELKRMEEVRIRNLKEMEEKQEKAMRLLSGGRLVKSVENPKFSLYEVDVEAVGEAFGRQVADVALKAYAITTRYQLLSYSSPRISMPLTILHAYKYLRSLGDTPYIATPVSWIGNILNPLSRYSIMLFSTGMTNSDEYCYILIKPKKKLPPIPKAEVIRSGNRIILLNP